MRNWKTRLTETWAFIEGNTLKLPAGPVATVKAYHGLLTDPQKQAVSLAMAQGAYAIGITKADEKTNRKLRRALILVLMAKSNSGNAANDLARALAALLANMTPGMAEKRLKIEFADIPSAQSAMIMRQMADINWGGWDAARQRPLLVGCAIGRRGANGPGSLGCFVRRGVDVFILSNRHVLYQAGSITTAEDSAVVQPPHQLGGTYFDVVADSLEEDPTHDAAIAKVKSGIVCTNATPEGRAITGSNAVGTGAPVSKRGCATRHRCGTVSNGVSPNVNNNSHILIDQLLIDRDDLLDTQPTRIFQIQGDSGSVLLNAADEVVALMHGQATATSAQATHIGPILAHFGVTVLVGTYTAP